jgi:hypothetical protein
MRILRSFIAVLALLAGATPCLAQGSIPIALQQSVNNIGQPLAGCLLYIFQTGTVATPQNAFADFGLTQALPNPLACDQNGRLPMFYLANGAVHVRLTDSSGIVQFDYPTMQVLGPSSGGGGGGGGGTVDPTTIAATGDIKFRVTSETLTGWVKLNGQTIGSATSGASQLANASAQNLFVYLWTNCTDAHCPVNGAPGNRGVSALADFSANKIIALPDLRGSSPWGLDAMGNASPAGRLLAANVTSGGGDGVNTPGASGGASNATLAQTALPNVTLPIPSGQGSHVHGSPQTAFNTEQAGVTWAGGSSGGISATTAAATLPAMATSSINGNVAQTLVGTIAPFMLGTWYQKL